MIRHVQGIPSTTSAGAGGDPARPWRHIPPRRALVVVVLHVQGVPSTTAADAGDWKEGDVPAYGGIVIVNTLYWNMVLSTSNDKRASNSTRFSRKRQPAKIFYGRSVRKSKPALI